MFDKEPDPTAPIEICGKWYFWDAHTRRHKRAEDFPVNPARTRKSEAGDRDLASVPVAPEQRTRRKKPLRRSEDCEISQRVDVEIHTFRVHSCDTDAVFIKHALDAIVDRRVISQDTAEKIASIKFLAAEKVATYEEEGHLVKIIAVE
jgi:hypothetical protein